MKIIKTPEKRTKETTLFFSNQPRLFWRMYLPLILLGVFGCGPKPSPPENRSEVVSQIPDTEEEGLSEVSNEEFSEDISKESSDGSSDDSSKNSMMSLSRENIVSFFECMENWPLEKDEFETSKEFQKKCEKHYQTPIMEDILLSSRIIYENPHRFQDIFHYDADQQQGIVRISSSHLLQYFKDEPVYNSALVLPKENNYQISLGYFSSSHLIKKSICEYFLFLHFQDPFEEVVTHWEMSVEEARNLKEHFGCRLFFNLAPEIVGTHSPVSQVSVWNSGIYRESNWIPARNVEIQIYNTETEKVYPSVWLEPKKPLLEDEAEMEWDEDEEEEEKREALVESVETEESRRFLLSAETSSDAEEEKESRTREILPPFDISQDEIPSRTFFTTIKELYRYLLKKIPPKEEFITDEEYTQLLLETIHKRQEDGIQLDSWIGIPMPVEVKKIFQYDPDKREVYLGIPDFLGDLESRFWKPGKPQPMECKISTLGSGSSLQFPLCYIGTANPMVSVSMSPQNAKELKENLGCLVVFRLKQELPEKMEHNPWIVENSILIQDLNLWYYNQETGKVVFKWAVQEWCLEKAESDPKYAPGGRLPPSAYQCWKIDGKTIWATVSQVDMKEKTWTLERWNGERIVCHPDDLENGEKLLRDLNWLYKKKMWSFRLLQNVDEQEKFAEQVRKYEGEWYPRDISQWKPKKVRARFLYGDKYTATFYNEQTKSVETYALKQLGESDLEYLNKYGKAIGYQIEEEPPQEKERKKR